MSPRDHGRFGCSAIVHRAVFDWPGGKRLPVHVAPNLEHFAFGAGLDPELAPGGPRPDVLNLARREAIWLCRPGGIAEALAAMVAPRHGS
jgi:hypothetical protein